MAPWSDAEAVSGAAPGMNHAGTQPPITPMTKAQIRMPPRRPASRNAHTQMKETIETTDGVPDSVIGGREQLFHLLAEAAEVEHTLMCCYLYAAFSLKRGE